MLTRVQIDEVGRLCVIIVSTYSGHHTRSTSRFIQ